MKTTFFSVKWINISAIVFLTLLIGCQHNNHDTKELKQSIEAIDKIKSATYFSTLVQFTPKDTIHKSSGYFYREFINPADEFVGASYGVFNPKDTNQMNFCYDGNMRANINWQYREIQIDSFKNNQLFFRPVVAPFFTRALTIIKYALNSKDSVDITSTDWGDSIQYTFTIKDKAVEFYGNNAVFIPGFSRRGMNIVSRYDIWINKKDNLPFRIQRKLPIETTIESVNKVTFNTLNINNFIVSKYFPKGFPVNPVKNERIRTSKPVI
jgi:hypothetical protein